MLESELAQLEGIATPILKQLRNRRLKLMAQQAISRAEQASAINLLQGAYRVARGNLWSTAVVSVGTGGSGTGRIMGAVQYCRWVAITVGGPMQPDRRCFGAVPGYLSERQKMSMHSILKSGCRCRCVMRVVARGSRLFYSYWAPAPEPLASNADGYQLRQMRFRRSE